MISKLLKTLERGFRVMRSNTRLLFVGALVFLFPLLYIASLQSFYSSAQKSIESSDLRRIGVLHDVAALYIESSNASDEAFQKLSTSIASQNPDISEIRIVEKTPSGLRVRSSLDETAVGTVEQKTFLYDSVAFAPENTSFTFPYTLNEVRMSQAVRSVKMNSGAQYFLLTEHSFEASDAVMKSRLQQSYIGLTAIFIFLIALAYWMSRQIDWRQKHTLMEAKMAERDLFINMIAHEFRTPLTAINGYSSFLAESKTATVDEKRYIHTIQVSTARLLSLVNDFLEVARIQSGKMDVDLKPIDVQTVITGVVDVLSSVASEKGLALTYTPLAVPLMHTTDAKRLHQVLQNIVSNSIKYTEKGSVEISTEVTPLALTIRIKDTGMGISADDQKKLFAPFARVGGVENTAVVGTGLGMWITKQIIEILGGSISIESIKNVGTHAVITLKR
jgi:signal transduction histidine kinase